MDWGIFINVKDETCFIQNILNVSSFFFHFFLTLLFLFLLLLLLIIIIVIIIVVGVVVIVFIIISSSSSIIIIFIFLFAQLMHYNSRFPSSARNWSHFREATLTISHRGKPFPFEVPFLYKRINNEIFNEVSFQIPGRSFF